MLKRSLALGLVLCVASVANAGYTIDVILPTEPAGGYAGGETITAQVGLTGVGEADVFARLITFDFGATDGPLSVANWTWLPGYQNGQAICDVFPPGCGSGHEEFIFSGGNSLVNTTFSSGSEDIFNQIAIPGAGSIILGEIDVTLPAAGTLPVTYTLDAVNNAAPDANTGARLNHDFVSPTTIWGDFAGGTAPITVVPEPATLALLGIGGLAALRRKKATAKK